MYVRVQDSIYKKSCEMLLLILLLTPIHHVHAQVTAAIYNGPGDFAYDVQSMPDLDQKRQGLGASTHGAMFCVPTACMNLCGFAANFGFPGLDPGPGFWEGAANHQYMTERIAVDGVLFVHANQPHGGDLP